MTTALADALQTAGVIPTSPTEAPKPKKNGKKGHRVRKGRRWHTTKSELQPSIVWENKTVGTVHLTVQQCRLGRIHKSAGVYWAEITAIKDDSMIVVDFTTNLAEGVIPFYTKGGEVTDCGDQPIPSLNVPVKWMQIKGNRVPHTRVRDMDNADILLRLPNGEFIDLQVAVLTRGGTFYLSIQEVSSGQILKLTEEESKHDVGLMKVKTEHGTFVVAPLFDTDAYPGADFIKLVMPRSGPKFVVMAAKDEAYGMFADEEEFPAWSSITYPVEPGWPTGSVVMWFNPLVGGRVLCDDGIECFVPLQVINGQYHQNVMKAGGFPLLVRTQQVLLRYDTGEKGRFATEIKAIELPEDEE